MRGGGEVLTDLRQHTIEIPHHIIVFESQDADICVLQKIFSKAVVLPRRIGIVC